MNLGKLLGAGKSFISGRKPAAYRTDKRCYLPQFGKAKNPFATTPAEAVQTELSKSAGKQSIEPMKPTAAMSWTKAQPVSVASKQPAGSATWATRLNPASLFRAASPAADKAVAAVQTELCLEKVKVVHNDLSDADVEIVPMKSRPAPEPTVVAARPASRSWEVLGERIMKATAL